MALKSNVGRFVNTKQNYNNCMGKLCKDYLHILGWHFILGSLNYLPISMYITRILAIY